MPVLPTDANDSPNYTPAEHADHHNVLHGLNNELGNFVQSTSAPGSPVDGDLWLDTDEDAQSGTSVESDTARVVTAESTTSGTMTDLATAGPAVTLTVPASGKVWISVGGRISAGSATSGWMGVALSGANTVSATQNDAFSGGIGDAVKGTYSYMLEGLTPGSTTFTVKYRVDDAAASTSFGQRIISVMTLP